MNIDLPCCNPLQLSRQHSAAQGSSQASNIHGQNKMQSTSIEDDIPALAQELHALSVKERNQIYEDIHGVADVIEETPEMVATHIQEMKKHLQTTYAKKRKDLDRILFLRPSLQNDESFHLMFLRAKRFKSAEAAECMCAHFTNLVLLFGEELIAEPITLKHLTDQELRLIRTGAHQLLFDRESTGRAILVCTLSQWDVSDWKSFARYMWYNLIPIAEKNEDMQKRGIVVVTSFHGSYSQRSIYDFVKKIDRLSKHFPVFVNSLHYCHNNQALHVVLEGLKGFIPKEMRLRSRFHFGSALETKHALMSFGIIGHDWFDPGLGILSHDFLQAFIEKRRQAEIALADKQLAEEDTSFVLYPKPYDVLMGRAWYRYVKNWPGNKELSRLVHANLLRYTALDASSRLQKTRISVEIMQGMYVTHGTRFVEKREDNTGWQVVDDEVARKKVAQTIRTVLKGGMS